MTVYDCCPFLNENDIYEIRINQHWDYVDRFIVTEAGETHTGLKKPFNFDLERFEKYKSKLVYVKIDTFRNQMERHPDLLDVYSVHDRSAMGQTTEDWIRDHFQGNSFVKTLRHLGAQDDDIIYNGAVDEILTHKGWEEGLKRFEPKDTLYSLKSSLPDLKMAGAHTDLVYRPMFGFMLDMYAYKFNLFSATISAGQMCEYGDLKKILPGTARALCMSTHSSIENGGWHFTFMDNTEGEKVLTKQRSWAHSRDRLPGQQPKWEHTSVEEALARLELDYDTMHREITPETHPQYLIDNLDKYKDYILDVKYPMTIKKG